MVRTTLMLFFLLYVSKLTIAIYVGNFLVAFYMKEEFHIQKTNNDYDEDDNYNDDNNYFSFFMNDDKTCFGGSVLFLMWSFIFLSFPVHKIVIVERFFGWNI